MTTFYDVPANFLIPALAEQLKSYDAIKMPEWADVVKTGSSRERPPSQTDWWHTRGAALLRKVARQGPIGVTALSQEYGGRKNNGSKPNTPESAQEKSSEYSFNNLKTLDSYQLKSVDWSNQRGAKRPNSTTAEKSLLQDRSSSTKSLTAFDLKSRQHTPDLTSIDWK